MESGANLIQLGWSLKWRRGLNPSPPFLFPHRIHQTLTLKPPVAATLISPINSAAIPFIEPPSLLLLLAKTMAARRSCLDRRGRLWTTGSYRLLHLFSVRQPRLTLLRFFSVKPQSTRRIQSPPLVRIFSRCSGHRTTPEEGCCGCVCVCVSRVRVCFSVDAHDKWVGRKIK